MTRKKVKELRPKKSNIAVVQLSDGAFSFGGHHQRLYLNEGGSHKELYESIVNSMGSESQIEKAIEELSELIHALQKWKEKVNKDTEDHVIEEIADAYNMIEQLSFMFGVDKVREVRIQKLRRFCKIIQNKETLMNEKDKSGNPTNSTDPTI